MCGGKMHLFRIIYFVSIRFLLVTLLDWQQKFGFVDLVPSLSHLELFTLSNSTYTEFNLHPECLINLFNFGFLVIHSYTVDLHAAYGKFLSERWSRVKLRGMRNPS